MKIELQGFTSQSATLVLAAGDRSRLDVRLQVGAVSENVTVVAESPLVQTDSSTLSSLVTEKAVQDLPVNGRNFVRLVQLVPGATEGVPNSLASGTRPDDRRQTSAISINGALDNQNNQLLDGIDNNERFIGTMVVKPSIDAIAEVKVQTNMYTAEVGRTAGGVVNIITKSGSNDFHGSAFEFNRNDKFDSRNFFAAKDQPKPKLDQNQYGGSVGGPVKKNKTFFFADFEKFKQTQGVTFVSTVPTAKMRAGDFSEQALPIYDPTTTTRVAFANNAIPTGRLDPIALKYLALYPLPNAAGLANNFTTNSNRTQDSATADFRIDHRFSESSTLFARYSYNDVDTFTPGALPEVNGIQPGANNGQFPGPNTTKAHDLQTNFLHRDRPEHWRAPMEASARRISRACRPGDEGHRQRELRRPRRDGRRARVHRRDEFRPEVQGLRQDDRCAALGNAAAALGQRDAVDLRGWRAAVCRRAGRRRQVATERAVRIGRHLRGIRGSKRVHI